MKKTKLNNLTHFISKWIMVAVSATLMFAGVVSLLDGVDKVISYISAFIVTWLLIKEIL